MPLAVPVGRPNNLGVPITPISPDYGKRIESAREKRGWNQAQLAQAAGISQPTLSAIENGDTKPEQVKLDTVWKIADALGLPLPALAVRDNAAEYNVVPAPAPRSRVPMVSFVPAGTPGESVMQVSGHVEFDSPASKDAIALQVKGESMVRPDGTGFPSGCYILVEPRRKAKSGDFVVVRFPDQDEETFKQLVLDGQVLLLKPLNPEYPIHTMGNHVRIVGTVIEKRIIERF